MEKNFKEKIVRILKKTLLILSFVVTIIVLIDYMWVMSGSNKWELEIDKDGVQVYSLKTPGDKLMRFKAIIRGDYTLSQLAALFIIDDDLETCKDWLPNCVEYTRIKEMDSRTMYDTDRWLLDFPFPFSDREILLRTIISQDKKTKAVTADIVAVPNVLPQTDGVVRVVRMHNVWKYIPLENGQTEVQFIQDVDMGGLFPVFLLNLSSAEENFKFMHDELPKFLSKEKYRKAKISFIKE